MNEDELRSYIKIIKRLVFVPLNELFVKYGFPTLIDIEGEIEDVPTWGDQTLRRILLSVYMEEGNFLSVGSEEMDDIFDDISNLILNAGSYIFSSKYNLKIFYYDVNSEYLESKHRSMLTSTGKRMSDKELINGMIYTMEYYSKPIDPFK